MPRRRGNGRARVGELSAAAAFGSWAEKHGTMLEITEHGEGCLLAVRAQPGAKRNAVVGVQAGSLKVAVTAPAQDGRANDALVEVLRQALGVKRGQVELVRGATSRLKRVLIRGVTAEELAARLKPFAPS